MEVTGSADLAREYLFLDEETPDIHQLWCEYCNGIEREDPPTPEEAQPAHQEPVEWPNPFRSPPHVEQWIKG